ncbi:hypothetical protein [Trinickia sp. EG282A]|uniref:hypothetical protein n=1 Tax=Trinickia sp. EG282A TaxID=3237013 RepID=UPI0034D1DC44
MAVGGRRQRASQAFAIILSVASGAACAQEFSALAGGSRFNGPSESSYAWGFSYLQSLDAYNSLSYSWLNEGHFPGHHRDGFALQYWRRAWFFDRKLALGAGIGGYFFFDTTAADAPRRYSDVHGIALIYSVSATYYPNPRWFYQLSVNRTYSRNSINTTTALAGIGYRLDALPATHTSFDGTRPGPGSGDELTVFYGRTEVNSLTSPGSWARGVEYRHGFGPYVDATVSWLDEGRTVLTRRNGAAVQAWLGRSFFGNTLRLAVGAGPYVAVDTYRVQGATQTGDKVSVLVTMSASYQMTRHWLVRASWNRVLTGYDKDSDIYLAGVGYRF